MLARKFLLLLCVWAFAWSVPYSLPAQDWARKMFKEFEHDFGTVTRGANVEHRFVIENVYVEDLEIESVTSSCGCTNVSLSKRHLKTWEKGEVIAKFNTVGFSGARQATLTVRFSRPYLAEVQLQVKGVIRTDLQVAPGSIEFGTLAANAGARQSVEIRRFGNPNWKVLDVRSAYSHIGVTLKEIQRDSHRVSYLLSAGLKPTAPPGLVQGELVVIARDGNQDLKIPIPFSGQVVSTLQVSPPVLDLPNIKPGDVVTRKIILKAEKAFRITDVTCDNSAFSVQADSESKSIHFLEVTYKGESQPGKHKADLHFITDLSEQPTAVLPAVVNIITDEGSSN